MGKPKGACKVIELVDSLWPKIHTFLFKYPFLNPADNLKNSFCIVRTEDTTGFWQKIGTFGKRRQRNKFLRIVLLPSLWLLVISVWGKNIRNRKWNCFCSSYIPFSFIVSFQLYAEFDLNLLQSTQTYSFRQNELFTRRNGPA